MPYIPIAKARGFTHKLLAASLFLAVLCFALGSSETAVTVKGKNLDNIDEIVNNASGGSAELKKYSLGIVNYSEQKSDSSQRTSLIIEQIQNGGNSSSEKFNNSFRNSYGVGHSNSGRQAAVSSISGKSGKAVLWVDYNHDYSSKKLFVYPHQ